MARQKALFAGRWVLLKQSNFPKLQSFKTEWDWARPHQASQRPSDHRNSDYVPSKSARGTITWTAPKHWLLAMGSQAFGARSTQDVAHASEESNITTSYEHQQGEALGPTGGLTCLYLPTSASHGLTNLLVWPEHRPVGNLWHPMCSEGYPWASFDGNHWLIKTGVPHATLSSHHGLVVGDFFVRRGGDQD